VDAGPRRTALVSELTESQGAPRTGRPLILPSHTEPAPHPLNRHDREVHREDP